MTDTRQQIKKVEKIVVIFDICSSTKVLEDVISTENHRYWRNLHIRLKDFLVSKRADQDFEIYKFLGDGWILLFDMKDCSGEQLVKLLVDISRQYEELFAQEMNPVLQHPRYPIGITFGIDAGTLVRIVMNNLDEYIGRPLNVAARLQGAIKEVCTRPEGKLLMSKSSHRILAFDKIPKYAGQLIEVNLRNIAVGNGYQARLIDLN